MSSVINATQKNKYAVLQEAKIEINQLNSQYKIYKNLNLKINLNNLKENACKKFITLNKSPRDSKTTAIINDIKNTIETEYHDLFQKLKAELLALSSKKALKKIIRIMEDPNCSTQSEIEDTDDEILISDDEDNYGLFCTLNSFHDYDEHLSDDEDLDLDKIIEGKVNKVLTEFPDELLFNKKKISELSESNTKISQMLTSLEAIQENPQLNFNRTEIYPEIYTLHSIEYKSYSHVKSLSNILSGDCFFITLYGEASCTRSILSNLAGKKQKSHKSDDIITIYGPVDITAFARNVPDSFDKLKQFNIVLPKLFFFEVSNDAGDKMFLQWSKYLSFISHVIVFCSEDTEIKKDFQNFQKLTFDNPLAATLINCSPVKMDFKYNFNIESDDDEILNKIIFDVLYEKSDKFIPHETAERYAELIINEKSTFSIQSSQQNFDKDIINDYSLQMYNKSLDEFHQKKEKMLNQSYSLVKSKKYVDDFHINEQYSSIKDKIQEFLFINTYKKVWNEKPLVDVSKVLKAEIEKEFNSSVLKMRNIEQIGKLLKTNDKSFQNEATKIIPQINVLSPRSIQYTPPCSPRECKELKSKLQKQYSDIIQDQFGEQEMDQLTDQVSDELYGYLNENPIASDDEYGQFYMNLYKKHYEPSKDQLIKKTFQFVKRIRDVPSNYCIKEYTISIDVKSFELNGIKVDDKVSSFHLVEETTTHELYELVKKTYKLQKVPFVISKIIFDGKNAIQVEVFDDDSTISRIKANTFKVAYEKNEGNALSTSQFIQSMIVQKEIKIADDFIIRSHSKNAQFDVEYPKDHSGWFDVEFNITSPNPEESFGVNEGVLIYLKLSASEMNYLKEGNSIVHQSFSNKTNEWEIEEDQVFLAYPKCNTAVILLRHCSMHKITPIKTEINELIPSKHKNTKYSRDWEGMNGNRAYKRGGRPYFLPVGYIAEGILVDDFDENTCVGFHGTKARYVSQIIEKGFQLPSNCHGVGKGHWKLGKEIRGKKNWADAIFVSPSIKYSSLYGKHPIIAFSKGHCYVESGHVYHDDIRIVILQCRVNPSQIEVFANSTQYEIVDSNFRDDELEWRISDPTKIFPYRVLTRNIPKDTYIKFFKSSQ